MDTALISFLKDKSQYLKEFSLGQHIANPVLLGIILSFNQQELGEDLSLLESLDRLITDLHEPAHVSYCLIKFYKASGDYLQSSSSPNAKFAQIYYRTSMSLLDFQVIPSVKPLISNQFIHCFELFMKKYSKSTDFAKILVIGKKNIKLFQNVPVVLTSGIDENLIKISRVREEISLQNVFVSLDSLLRGLLGKDLGKMPEVMVFTKEIIEIIYKERASKEVLSEFSAKLPEFAMLFDIETRLKFDGLHREACQKIGLQNITGVFLGLQNISGVIKNVESRLIQIPVLENPQPVIIPLNKPKSIVKIPERGYNYIEPEVKDVGKDEPPAFITESLNQQTVDILIDIISEYRTQWGKTQVVNTIDVKNGFESIANYSIDFKRELQSSFKQLIEKEKDKNSLDFWKQIIEAAELYLDQNEIDFLLVLAFEKIDKYEDYDRQENIRGRGNLRKRPNSRGAARNSGYSDRSDLDFNWENMSLGPEKNSGNFSEYYPPSNSFGIQPMPSNFIKVQEKPLSQQEGFQFKKKEKALEMPPPLLSPKLQPGLIPKDSNPMNSYFSEFGQKDLQAPPFKSPVCEVRHDVQPMKFPTEMVPNPLQKPLGPDPSNSPMYPIQVAEVKQINPVEQAPPPEVPKGQILVPANRLIETLTSDASNIINKSKGGYDEIMLLNELLTEIKQNMKQKSPSATISFIGSSLIGTYLKSTDADIVFTDFLNPDPISLLTSTISALNIGRTFQSSQVLVFIPHKFKLNFNFFINDEISFEVSSLFKEYCKIDSRCHDLIILSKQWTRTKKIQDCINGFHMSLLVISFLQLSDPPILPRIQQTPHQAKMIGNYDVWFDKNVEFDCQNLCTLGELFQLFLHFLQDLMGYEYALDIKQGVVLECKSDKIYSAPHPFMESEVSQLTKGTEFAQKWVQVLASTLASVDSGERLLKIIA